MTSCTNYAQGIKYKIFNDTKSTKILVTAEAINASATTCGTSTDATYCTFEKYSDTGSDNETVVYVVDDCTCIASGDTYNTENNCIEVGNNGQYKIQVEQEGCTSSVHNCTLDCVKDATMTWQYGSCVQDINTVGYKCDSDSGVSAENSCESDSDCPIGIIDKKIEVKGDIDAMTC